MIFPNRLRMAREARQLSKVALAHTLSLSKVSIGEFESGRKVPSVNTLVMLANVLDVSVDWLTGRTDNCHSHHQDGKQ